MRYHNFVGGADKENNGLALYPTNFRSGSDPLLNVDPNVIIGSIPGVPGGDPFGHRASLLARLRTSFGPTLGELAWSAETNLNCSSEAINRFNGSNWFLVNRTITSAPAGEYPAHCHQVPWSGCGIRSTRCAGGQVTATRVERKPGHDWRTPWLLGADLTLPQCRYP